MNFKYLTDELSASIQLHNGDWPYWFIIRVIDMEEATGDVTKGRYLVELHAVSPEAAGEENLKRAMGSCGGYTRFQHQHQDVGKTVVLMEYGISACLVHRIGNNRNRLMKEIRKEASIVRGMFGFYMDRALNKVGSTGWDLIKGQLTIRNRSVL